MLTLQNDWEGERGKQTRNCLVHCALHRYLVIIIIIPISFNLLFHEG